MTIPPPDLGGAHRAVEAGGPGFTEPVIASHIVSGLIWAAAAGGLAVDPGVLTAAGAVVAVAVSCAAAIIARSRVSPGGRVTWDTVGSAIRIAVSAEVDRLAAAAPQLAASAIAAAVAQQAAAAAFPAPTSAPDLTAPLPAVTPSSS